MQFNNPYWSETLKISALQRWVIVNSIIYYEFNDNIASDKYFDLNARQLAKMILDSPSSSKASDYFYCMFDFDGMTGFDLWNRLNEKDKIKLKGIADSTMRFLIKGENTNENKGLE